MLQWKTDLLLNHSQDCITIPNVAIKTGRFQGDSLSPLLFCLALAPLSILLNDNDYGFDIEHHQNDRAIVSHLLYMVDLKIYARSEQQMNEMLDITRAFSRDIQMKLGLEKCARVYIHKGKLKQSATKPALEDSNIRHLEPEDAYKYLGVNESSLIHHKNMKEKVKTEYTRRVRMILKSELSSPNKIKAINSLAVPVLLYTFGVIDWTKTDIQGLDRKTRKLLTMYNMHHPKADVHRLYIGRKEGGRGLMQLEINFNVSCTGLYKYLKSQKKGYLAAVFLHEKEKKGNSISSTALRISHELKIELNTDQPQITPAACAKIDKVLLKQILMKDLQQTARDKPLHGQYLRNLENQHIDIKSTTSWLSSADLKGPTESLIVAAQDQAISTNYIRNKIWGENIDPKCRLCKVHDETVEHILAGCPLLAKKDYLQRHNTVARYLHWLLCKQFDIEVHERWYDHDPLNVVTNDSVVLIWDTPVQTDKTISANRPDIIVKNKLDKSCLLIDVSVPADRNIHAKRAEKLCKYKDLEIEIQKMWAMKTSIAPLIIGSLGTIAMDTSLDLARISPDASLYQVQKQVLLGSAYILRKFF